MKIGIIEKHTCIDNVCANLKNHTLINYQEYNGNLIKFCDDIDECWVVSSYIKKKTISDYKEICQRIAENGVKVKVFLYIDEDDIINHPNIEFIENETKFYESSWRDLEVPVIVCGGVTSLSNTFEISQKIKVNLIGRGYNPILVSCKKEAKIFGDIILPWEMIVGRISENEKAKCINNFFNKLEQKYNPDVFIVDLPDSLIAYDKDYFPELGLVTNTIITAIGVDAVVTSLFPIEYSDTYLEMLMNSIVKSTECENIVNTLGRVCVNDTLTFSKGEAALFPVNQDYVNNMAKINKMLTTNEKDIDIVVGEVLMRLNN